MYTEVFDAREAFEAEELLAAIRNRNHLAVDQPLTLLKRSIDARGKTVRIVSQYVLENQAPTELAYTDVSGAAPAIIIGAGPAGLFAALRLIELGIKPIILERGKNVRDRRRDIAAINKNLAFNKESNYCFGEGGAGTYSDGKLYTRSTKRGNIRRILDIFVRHGAKADILIDAHPHIGTNVLPKVIAQISETIIAQGGEIHFDTKFSGLLYECKKVTGAQTTDGRTFQSSSVILATGHSAKDIFLYLHDQGITIESKPFAIGVRVEHPQSLINSQLYKSYSDILPPAAYAVNRQYLHKGREKGVFSFCMCPGGFIVPSSTSESQQVVNGMSPSRRDSKFANSGLVVSVDQNDYGTQSPLDGLFYQQKLEEKAYEAGAGFGQSAPSQLLSDFVKKKPSKTALDTSYQPGLHPTDASTYLPPEIYQPLLYAMPFFDRKIKGFLGASGQLIGLESRTSSPVKIPRDLETYMHPELQGLFPCGEGAGYAGGILSAAMDGEKCAEAVHRFLLNV